MYLKKGDKVVVTAGNDKGKEGIIQKVLNSKNKVVIENINVAKKHYAKGQGIGTFDKELGIHASNVMLLDPETNKPTRVGFIEKDGKKVRVSKKTQKEI